MATSARDAIRAAVEALALTTWVGAGGLSTAIAWAEVDFNPTPEMGMWLAVHTMFGRAEVLTIGLAGTGYGFDELPVVVKLSVFSRESEGTGDATARCDAIVDGFARQRVGAVRFLSTEGPVPVAQPEASGSGWAQRTITFTGYAEMPV